MSLLLALGVSVSAQVVDKPPQNPVRFIKPLPLGDEAKGDPMAGAIDLSLASHGLNLSLAVDSQGNPLPFALAHTRQGGWARQVAAGNPRTPGATDTLVVVGSGSGSQVFGLDLNTGGLVWTAQSKDAGISNIELAGDSAYYTTWSCTLERVRISTGKLEYSIWLASTVNTAPTVQGSKAYCSFQGEQGNRLTSHDAATGARNWSICTGAHSGITAPVVSGKLVLLAQTDGTLACYAAETGQKNWKRSIGMLAAPVVTSRGLLLVSPKPAKLQSDEPVKPRKADSDRDTIVPEKNNGVAGRQIVTLETECVSVIDPATDPGTDFNVRGYGSEGLDYQGSRPVVENDIVFFATKGRVSATSAGSGMELWNVPIAGAPKLTTPVVSGDMVMFGTDSGHIAALHRRTGKLVWSYHVQGHSFEAAPIVSNNRLLITTRRGAILAIPTGLDQAAGTVRQDEAPAAPPAANDIARDFEKNRRQPLPPPVPIDPAIPPPSAVQEPPVTREEIPPQPAVPEPPTKGQQERIEKRKAERAEREGRNYEPKPFKRE